MISPSAATSCCYKKTFFFFIKTYDEIEIVESREISKKNWKKDTSMKLLCATLALCAVNALAIYPDDHWDYATRVRFWRIFLTCIISPSSLWILLPIDRVYVVDTIFFEILTSTQTVKISPTYIISPSSLWLLTPIDRVYVVDTIFFEILTSTKTSSIPHSSRIQTSTTSSKPMWMKERRCTYDGSQVRDEADEKNRRPLGTP